MAEAGGRPRSTAIAIVGCVVPDDSRFHGPAFNRAAQMFNDELIRGLASGELGPATTFSVEPLPSFPRGSRLFGRMGSEFLRAGTRVRLLPFINVHPLKVLTGGLSTFAALMAWAFRHRADRRVMHVINLTMPPGWAVWLAARLTRSVASVSVLDVWQPGALVPDTYARRLDFAVQRWLLPRFDRHMVVAEAIADDFFPGRRVCLLEGGVAPDRLGAGPRSRESLDPAPFRMVLAGSLEPYNGIRLALAALAILPPDVELVVAGTGSLAGEVQAASGRETRLTHRGFLSFDEVMDLYASADLLLNLRLTADRTTRYFFPSKLMELLASGTPVLSTSSGHTASEYGHVLYLLDDETPAGLARRVLEIRKVAPTDRRALGARARAFMLEHKTWARQGARLVAYLKEGLSQDR